MSPTCMAQGDGKRRRKKADPKDGPPPPPSPSAKKKNAPANSGRVSGDALLSVRKQIAIAKAFKAKSDSPPKFVTRTSFRKTKALQTSTGASGEGAASKTASKATREASAKLAAEQQYSDTKLPLMYVDGYNVIGKWPRLKKHWDRGDIERARKLLCEDMFSFAAGRYEAVVVFDANGAKEREDKHTDYFGMAVVFAHNSADEFIERETLLRNLEKEKRQVIAATSDGAIQTAASVHGALVVTSKWLVNELKAIRKGTTAAVNEMNKRTDRHMGRVTLYDLVDERTQDLFDSAKPQRRPIGVSKLMWEQGQQVQPSADGHVKGLGCT